jgi:hypothetical protein
MIHCSVSLKILDLLMVHSKAACALNELASLQISLERNLAQGVIVKHQRGYRNVWRGSSRTVARLVCPVL